MTTPRDTPASRRSRANGDGTVYQRKDSRWEAAGYVLAPGNTRSFLDRAGLRRVRFHDLRHSTATLLLEQGIDLVVIKELLGHSHIGVTADVYAHVRLRLQRQAIDALNAALGGHTHPDNPPPTTTAR